MTGATEVRTSNARLKLAAALLAWAPRLHHALARRAGRTDRGREPVEAENRQADLRNDSPRILLVNDDLPDPDRDAGAKAIFHLVELLREADASVVFWSDADSKSPRGRDLLAKLGVEIATRARHGSLADWLVEQGPGLPFDAVVLNRPMAAAIHGDTARKLGAHRLVYYGHDIHYRRMRAGRRLGAASISAFELACMATIEKRIWRNLDCVLYPSEQEAAVVNAFRQSHRLAPNAAMLPLWSTGDRLPNSPSPAGRSGLLFVGSFAHPPNIDGLDWFFREVLPRVRSLGCQQIVRVVGNGMQHYVPDSRDGAVEVRGWVDAGTLESLYAHARVVVAPLRYGGGVKGKVLEAMAHGVPCVATAAAIQGLPASRTGIEPADDPGQFAANIGALVDDDDLWAGRSRTALAYLHAAYGRAALRQRALRLILGDPTPTVAGDSQPA
jgi:glycosyltransferase involved in cell wall biosynthesis